jgi:hypothetical protein
LRQQQLVDLGVNRLVVGVAVDQILDLVRTRRPAASEAEIRGSDLAPTLDVRSLYDGVA